jgi:hypothetical protein
MVVTDMSRPNWEYRVMPIGSLQSRIEARVQDPENLVKRRPEAEKQLNALGREGWELVSIVRQGHSLTAVLKRPRAD